MKQKSLKLCKSNLQQFYISIRQLATVWQFFPPNILKFIGNRPSQLIQYGAGWIWFRVQITLTVKAKILLKLPALDNSCSNIIFNNLGQVGYATGRITLHHSQLKLEFSNETQQPVQNIRPSLLSGQVEQDLSFLPKNPNPTLFFTKL